jgi:multidrug efflux pump subunit AcrB
VLRAFFLCFFSTPLESSSNFLPSKEVSLLSLRSSLVSDVSFPMLSGTLVTAAGFMPVGLANSTTGEYAGGIFWVVGLALLASWVVAVVFTPFLGVLLLPAPKPGGS